MKKSYRSTLKKQVSLALLFSLLAISVFFISTYYQSALGHAKENNLLNTKTIALYINQALFEQVSLIDKVSRSKIITELPIQIEYSQAAVKELQKLAEKSTFVASIVIDTDGEIVEAFPVDSFKVNMDQLSRFALEQLERAEINQAPRLFYLKNYADLKGAFATEHTDDYFIVIAPLIARSRSFIHPEQPLGAMIAVLSVRNSILPSIESNTIPNNSSYTLSLGEASLIKESNGELKSNYIKNSVLVSSVYISHEEQADLYFSLSVPEKYYLKDVYRTIFIMIVVILASLLIVFLIINKLINRLAFPLLQIIETGKRFSRGQYSVSQANYRYREFDEINRVLKEMAETINRQFNELTIEKENAMQSERLKSQFLANMSHEIRTPMNSVVGFIQVLEESPLNDEQSLYINRVKRSCFLLLNIINDILDLSKIEENKLRLVIEPCNLVDIVIDTMDLFAYSKEDKDLTFAQDFADDFPQQLLCDEIRVKQILTNLISNAVKFTDNGQITVSLNYESLGNGQYTIIISVKDTGIGIETEKQESLFQPFVQADGKTSRRHGGTGLGLSICRNLVQLMNGEISLISEVGKGSEFIIKIPATEVDIEQQTEVPKPVDSSLQRLKGVSLLIAEDNMTNQLVLKALLSPLGVQLDFASNGIEACAKTRNNEYHAILMDVQMPEMDGIEATQIILSQNSTSTPIIGVSANAMKEDLSAAKAAGMVDYISKPIIKEELYNTLLKWIRSSS